MQIMLRSMQYTASLVRCTLTFTTRIAYKIVILSIAVFQRIWRRALLPARKIFSRICTQHQVVLTPIQEMRDVIAVTENFIVRLHSSVEHLLNCILLKISPEEREQFFTQETEKIVAQYEAICPAVKMIPQKYILLFFNMTKREKTFNLPAISEHDESLCAEEQEYAIESCEIAHEFFSTIQGLVAEITCYIAQNRDLRSQLHRDNLVPFVASIVNEIIELDRSERLFSENNIRYHFLKWIAVEFAMQTTEKAEILSKRTSP